MSESSPPPQVEPSHAVSEPEPDHTDTSPAAPVEKQAEEDRRATKRRRNCPESLDRFQESSESDGSRQQSFTFDTCAAPAPEFTPKFGSFKLPEAATELAKVVKRRVAVPDGKETTAEAEREEEAANGIITGN